jgi:hypothetical protein
MWRVAISCTFLKKDSEFLMLKELNGGMYFFPHDIFTINFYIS